MIAFTVPGHAKPSVRITKRQIWTDKAQQYLQWQNAVAIVAKAHVRQKPLPWEFYHVTCRYYFATLAHGDMVNLTKAMEDGLQHGEVIANDKQVRCHDGTGLFYVGTAAEERVEVELREYVYPEGALVLRPKKRR